MTKKLFLSERIVSEDKILNGGLLVDENGVIDSILDRAQSQHLIDASNENIEVIDGGKLALIAGVVDSHVHVNEPGRTHWEGFLTATAAAATGGITTIVDMPLISNRNLFQELGSGCVFGFPYSIRPPRRAGSGWQSFCVRRWQLPFLQEIATYVLVDGFLIKNSVPATTTVENLKIKLAAAEDNVYTDVAFWGGVIPGNQDSLKDLVNAGVVGFKCFLCPSGVEEFPHVERKDLVEALKALEGTGSVLAFHAEVEDENQTCSANVSCKNPEDYNTYLETRPADMELNAVSMITELLPSTNVRLHIVHVSSADVIPILDRARENRLKIGNKDWCAGITAETCHHYLTLNSEDVPTGRSEYKCAPPIRDEKNKEKLWNYLKEDKINLVVSDHSPCTPDLKCSNHLQAWGGISSVQFGLSLFWSGASFRGFSLLDLSKYLSQGPAMLCGIPISERKGRLKPGFDADIVFFDTDATLKITPEVIRHKNKLTPYIGKELKGVVVQTYLRGQLIFTKGELLGKPRGKLLFNV